MYAMIRHGIKHDNRDKKDEYRSMNNENRSMERDNRSRNKDNRIWTMITWSNGMTHPR